VVGECGIAKSIGFCLVEMVRFVPNLPLQALKKRESHVIFHVIAMRKNVDVTSFRKNLKIFAFVLQNPSVWVPIRHESRDASFSCKKCECFANMCAKDGKSAVMT
jgi:hypothetical protein